MLIMTSRPGSGSVRRAAVNDSPGDGQSRSMPRILPVYAIYKQRSGLP